MIFSRAIRNRLLLCLGPLILLGGCDSSPQSKSTTSSVSDHIAPSNISFSNTLKKQASINSELCSGCHQNQVHQWQTSHHAEANRPVSLEKDLPAFTPQRTLKDSATTSVLKEQDGSFLLSTTTAEGKKDQYKLEAVIGHTPVRQYLTRLPGNKLQAVSKLYEVQNNRWVDVFTGENRQPGEWGHWTGQGMNWNANCGYCHTTNFKKRFNFSENAYDSTWQQQGVACASCHGGLQQHLQSAGDSGPLLLPTQLNNTQLEAVCASCHSRRDQLTADGFQPGDLYHDHFRLALPDQPELYYADGQIRGEVFAYGSFAMSRMKHAGVTCMDCHNPHTLETILPVGDNSLCLRCHQSGLLNAPIIDPPKHTFHPAGSTGNQCVNCHMPKTTYMQADPRADHGFLIPDPLLTKELDIPNACNRCHSEQNIDWAVDWSEKWYGKKLAGSMQRQRAQAISNAYNHKPEAQQQLLDLIKKETIPAWQATYIGLLSTYLSTQQAIEVIVKSTQKPHPLIKSRAAEVLPTLQGNRQKIMDLLADKTRVVRIAVAQALASQGVESPNLSVQNELHRYLEFHSDRPQSLLILATMAIQQQNTADAATYIHRAINLDSKNPEAYHQGAILLSAAQLNKQATALLLKAVELFPENAVFPYSLGLLAAQGNNITIATQYLQQTVTLDPGFIRAWYNLSLAYQKLGRIKEAQEAMQQVQALQEQNH